MKYRSVFFLMVVCCLFPLATFDPAAAQNINIDLSAEFGTPANTFGAAADQAGIWNTLRNGVTSNLLDIAGSTTIISATVTSDDDTGYSSGTCSENADALLDDNIYSMGGNTWSVVLSGLTNGVYTVYLYGPTNSVVSTGNMLVNDVAVPSITGDSCDFVNGTTYTTIQASVNSSTLAISGIDPEGYSGLAGLQIIELQQGCTLSQGYWKNHPQSWPKPTSTPFFLSSKTWYQVLSTFAKGGNAYYILARQYIAAKLNILSGAASTSEVDAALAWAENSFFNTYSPSSSPSKSVRTNATSYSDLLDSYNKGVIGPGYCSQ